MTACVIGEVIQLDAKSILVEDRLSQTQYTCELEGDELLSLKVGDQGIFVGQYYGDILKVRRVEVRKFLDPLYEADLYDASGKFNLIPVLHDPFTATYLEYLEKQRILEEQRLLEAEALEEEAEDIEIYNVTQYDGNEVQNEEDDD